MLQPDRNKKKTGGEMGKTIEEVIHHGTIIEDYPDDPRGPSCFVLSITQEGRRSCATVCR